MGINLARCSATTQLHEQFSAPTLLVRMLSCIPSAKMSKVTHVTCQRIRPLYIVLGWPHFLRLQKGILSMIYCNIGLPCLLG